MQSSDQISNHPSIPGESQTAHWPSIWQLGLGLVGSLALWGLALAVGLLGLLELVSPFANRDATPLFLMAAGAALFGGLLLPSSAYSLARLLGRPISLPIWIRLSAIKWGIWILPFVLLFGHWASSQVDLAWLLLPPLHLLALGLPILWVLWRGLRGLSMGTPQRAWGVFAAGLVIGPALIFILEALAVLSLFLLGAAYLSARPEVLQELNVLLDNLRAANQDTGEIVRLLEPYLTQPVFVLTILAFSAGIVPVIEELLKPIGVWLLINRELTPAEGFAAGMISGAGFALFENIALASQAEGWSLAVTARAGTSIFHIVTSGFMGWALVWAWRHGKYGRLVLAYLATVAFHGLWNGLALLTLSTVLDPSQSPLLGFPQILGQLAPIGLVALILGALLFLRAANRNLQSTHHPTGEIYGTDHLIH